MKKVLFCLLVPVLAVAQQKPDSTLGWKNALVAGLQFTQAGVDNWAEGGEDALSWIFDVHGSFSNRLPKVEWSTAVKVLFGMSKIGKQESRKVSDELRLESMLAYNLKGMASAYASATGLTQLAPGYRYDGDIKTALSGFFDPAMFVESIGIGLDPGKIIKTRLGAALKETITRDHPVPFSDDPDTPGLETSKIETGAEWVFDLSVAFGKTMTLASKCELFSNLKSFDRIDVNWDTQWSAKVSSLVNVGFNFRLLYDRDISKKRQIKQMLMVGISYALL